MTEVSSHMISPAEVQAIAVAATSDAHAFVEAHRVAVVDLDSLQQAIDIRTAIKARQNTITTKLAEPKSWAHKLHAWFCDLERTALAPLNKLDAYEQQQVQAFHAAEAARIAAREQELAAERRREEQDRAAAEAATLETAGEPVMAAAVVAAAIAAPPPVVVLPTVKAQVVGLKTRRSYLWRYVGNDQARAMALLPREFLTPDETKLSNYARSMKGSAKVPGIEFYSEDVPVR